MPKEVVVDARLFKLISAAAPGEEVVGIVHLHIRPVGKCNVVHSGGRPVACMIRPHNGKKYLKHGRKSPAHPIVFRRQ